MKPGADEYLSPSPVTSIELVKGITIDVKRDDLIHADISGNKWRKLKYNVLKAYEEGCDTLLTFGGAFSNHIAATAKAAELCGFKSIGIIRGMHAQHDNPTLAFAQACGMQLINVPAEEYDLRNSYQYHDQLKLEFPGAYIVAEGGGNYQGVLGCMEITKELDKTYNYICCAVGTGTTAAGLILSKPAQTTILAFSVFKSAEGIRDMINKQLNLVLNETNVLPEYTHDVEIIDGYGFGGYAKVNDELKDFVKQTYAQHQLPLDLVYTGKMVYGLADMLRRGAIKPGADILVYHSGGLQGNKGFRFQLDI